MEVEEDVKMGKPESDASEMALKAAMEVIEQERASRARQCGEIIANILAHYRCQIDVELVRQGGFFAPRTIVKAL